MDKVFADAFLLGCWSYFVGQNNYETKRIEYQPEDVAFVKGLITDTYARIMRQEDCSWCHFLKALQQVDSFADMEGVMIEFPTPSTSYR